MRDDPASPRSGACIWRAWRRGPLRRNPVAPDLTLAARDPFALRYVALTALVMALMFGSIWRAASVAGLDAGRPRRWPPARPGKAGPSRRAYTGKPALYLNDITQATLDLPVGTRIQMRLYGEVGALTLAETVSGARHRSATGASDPVQDFDGAPVRAAIEIAGPGGRDWQIIAPRPMPCPTRRRDRRDRRGKRTARCAGLRRQR